MALVLNRTPQQQIYLSHPDGRITVTVLDVSGAKVDSEWAVLSV